MKKSKPLLLSLLITAVIGFVVFYFELPAINLQNSEFYGFAFMLAAIFCVAYGLISGAVSIKGVFDDPQRNTARDFFKNFTKTCKVPLVICVALFAISLVGGLLSSVIFRSSAYTKLLTVETGDFASEVDEISFNSIPMLDKESATRLARRKLGELADMVSQFEVVDDSTQINYKGKPVRVSVLRYGDIIKWLNNSKEGIPGYIITDMITQECQLVRLDRGIKYSPYDLFGRNLQRHLRFAYPTFMFADPVFEIDDNGTPYWICSRIVKTIGLFGGTDVKGAVLVNAVTGEHEYYEEVPTWVDHVYDAELIVQQYDYYGRYQHGFINASIGQKGVTKTTAGYNYIALDDDVYVYTGITSVGADESNIGFILTNQRTKETKFYAVAGAEEFSACESAEGVTQDLKYKATFPILLNVNGRPTYFMSLKDSAGLVKMYAMVNVQQYQIVATGTTVENCRQSYEKLLLEKNVISKEEVTTNEISGQIAEIRTAVVNGTSYYYVRLNTNTDVYYVVSAAENPAVIICNVGDSARINYREADKENALVNATDFAITGKADGAV